MKLVILDAKNSEELDAYQTDEWLFAVQYVEHNKQTYKAKGCSEVIILEKKKDVGVIWELTDGIRSSLLKDKPHKPSKRTFKNI